MMEEQKSVWPYIKGYKFNSLLFKNFAYVFILVTLPLLLVLSLNYKEFTSVINKRIMDMNEELLHKNAAVTDNVMDGILNVLDELCQMPEVIQLTQMDGELPEYSQKASTTISQVNERVRASGLVVSAYIYSDVNGMMISGTEAKPAAEVQNKGKWFEIHKQFPMKVPYVLVNRADSIYICQPLWTQDGKRAGLFVLDVELQRIRDLLESQQEVRQGIFFIMDISGQTMYCNEESYLTWDKDVNQEYKEDIATVKTGETLLVADHTKRVISVTESIHQSWRYAFVTEMPEYRSEMGVIRGFLLPSIAVGVLASAIVAYIITLLTYRPMRKIMNVIKNPQLHWSEREASKESNELLYITSNILADRNINKEISEELEERIRLLRQAQFRALQFQIDPHFLYNTLETIKWSAVEEIGLGNKTSKMLTKVARLYRLSLENDDVIISLKEELDFLKLYIEIVRIRFGDSIQFHWNIEEDLYDCSVIKMCLQPIVENAISHGLRPKNYQGNITISARYEKECLYISVDDDGQNISKKEIETLNEKLKTGSGFEESKVGLRNVNERIKLIYGKKYGVSVSSLEPDAESTSEQTANVRVVLTFPCRNLIRSEEKK